MANTTKRIDFDSKRLRRLLKRRKIKQNEFTRSMADVNAEVFHRALVSGKIMPDQLNRIAKSLNVDPRYLKGDDMLEYWSVEEPYDQATLYEAETDEDGIPYGTWNDYLVSESIQGIISDEEKTARMFEQWLFACDWIHWVDDGNRPHDFAEYVRSQKQYEKYRIPYGAGHLMNIAIKAVNERLQEDYKILQLMENYEERKKGRKEERNDNQQI